MKERPSLLTTTVQGATADLIEGMGHDLPAELLSHFADSIRINADRVKCVV